MDNRDDDQLYWQACDFVVRGGRPTISTLQRRFKVGFYQAERWVRRMEETGWSLRRALTSTKTKTQGQDSGPRLRALRVN